MPWTVLNKDQAEGKVKISSTPITVFVQYTTEELDQLDQPQHSHSKGQEGVQYPTAPPLVYIPHKNLLLVWIESQKKEILHF